MTPANLSLILLSACIHVVAHAALRRATQRTAFVWWVLLWGGVVFLPVLIFNWQPLSPAAVGVMALSAIFEALYFYAMARAYDTGELSTVYPLARGTAPVLLLVWSRVWLRESPTPGGALGVVTIAIGLYLINLPRPGAWIEPLRAFARPGPRWALLAGLCISLYTAVDRVGITLLDPLLYTCLALWITWGLMTPLTLREVGWLRIREELRRTRWSSVIAGATTLTAYALVLYAIRNGTPTSYAGATREVSVVLGVIAGVVLLKEPGTAMKFAGAACVSGGVALIQLLG